MSHAQTGRRMLVGSLLTKEHLTGWLYTANAVTASSPKEMLLSPWIIASHPKPQQFEKQQFIVTFDSKLMIKICLASGIMTAYKKRGMWKKFCLSTPHSLRFQQARIVIFGVKRYNY